MPAVLDNPTAQTGITQTGISQPEVDYFQAVDTLSAPPHVPPPAPRLLAPGGTFVDLLLTALAPISHHDPATADKSNTLLFNRRRQIVSAPAESGDVSQSAIYALCAAHPAPEDVAPLLQSLSLPEFTACCLARLFLDFYNAGDGVGVFKGLSRYELLETRLRVSAVKAVTLRGLWDRLCDALQAPIHGAGSANKVEMSLPGGGVSLHGAGWADRLLLSLLCLPRPLQAATLRAITEDYRSIVALARLWHSEAKAQSASYAEKSGREQAAPSVMLSFPVWSAGGGGPAILDVPHVTGNSLRHQVVRAPGWRHLARRLGLTAGLTGEGELPAGVEAVFENGGNIRAGAKQPSDPFGLAAEVRAAHPLLELLGGTTDSFDLGESRLHVGSWLVCRENAPALSGTGAAGLDEMALSAFDLLDDVTHTRQATERGVGQMIYSFETLCAGTQVLCRLHLAPDTGRLALGALAAAVDTYLGGLSEVGGQKARGFGWTSGKLLSCPDEWDAARAEYEAYLDTHAEALRTGLADGTLGARNRVVS